MLDLMRIVLKELYLIEDNPTVILFVRFYYSHFEGQVERGSNG